MVIKSFKYIFLAAMSLFFISCEPASDKTALIEKKVKLKVNSLIDKKIDKCKQKALDDAEVYVDSVISEITQNSINRGLDFPDKPEKKDTDSLSFKIEIDSMDIDEIIDSLKLTEDTTNTK